MRTSVVFAALAGSAAVILVAAGAALGRTQATTVQLTGGMTAAKEVPAPTGNVSGARGTFTATATKTASGGSLAWRLTFQGLTGPATAAHVHIGAVGEPGPVAVPLCGPCETGASGNASITEDTVNAINTGRAYVNVHTAANAPGEIRAQVSVSSTNRTTLNALQEVPRPKGRVGRASGAFSYTVTKTGPTAVLTWRLSFTGLTGRAVAAHIHLGARGRAGAVALALCGPCRSGASGRVANVRASLLTALEAGRAYVNVHTPRNPAGEIRGQLPAPAVTLGTAGSSSSGGGALYPGG
jgi:CHRD domain